MEEMLNKLEFMLMGLKQMKTTVIFTWFPKIDRKDIINAISESQKFKIEGDIISLKSETEIYEEQLQRDILKGLLEDDDEIEGLLEFDEELDIIESVINEEDIVEIDTTEEIIKENLDVTEIKEKNIDSVWANVQELATKVSNQANVNENSEDILKGSVITSEKEIENDDEIIKEETAIDKIETINEEVTIEDIEQKEIIIKHTSDIKGTDLEYSELIRLISEYNEGIANKIENTDENNFENKEKAIIKFYENKYVVKYKEKYSDLNANIYSLINKKKGMEVAYLLISETLDEDMLKFMIDKYEDEVVYFCPTNNTEIDFEVGLNEFYLKDTSKIFDKYLERYVITEEREVNIKNLEIVIGR